MYKPKVRRMLFLILLLTDKLANMNNINRVDFRFNGSCYLIRLLNI